MKVLFVFLFWLANLLSSTPNQPSVRPLGTSAKSSAMSVKLIAFNAKSDGSSNILEWQTISEVNTREFIIERSADGKDFSLAFWITPKGAPNSSTFYRYTDTTAGQQSYYRLRMVEADGKEQVSRIIAVKQSAKS